MSRSRRLRTSAQQLAELREEISGRDLALLDQVAALRLMSGKQLEAVHFQGDGREPAAAARAARRTLQRLTEDRLLLRLRRRIGGVRAGSGSFVYAIGPVGERLLELSRPRRRDIEPSSTFLRHTLAVSQVVVDLTVAARQRQLEVLGLQSEPRCWRRAPGLGGEMRLLRPDLFVVVGAGEYEYRWFVEVDLGSEHLPTLLRKCRSYQLYYQAGIEQAEHGVFPRVLWLMHEQRRVERLQAALLADRSLNPNLFVIAERSAALRTLTGSDHGAAA